MRILPILMLAFLLLAATNVLAQGLAITKIDARADYEDSLVYRIEQEQQITRINNAPVPVANNSKVDVEVFPGSNLTFGVRVENKFNGGEHVVRNIVVTATIEGVNGGGDLEEKSTDFDIDSGNDNRVDIKFKIPFDVETKTYNVKVEAEGDDMNRTPYKTEVRLKLDIKKLSHDVRIAEISLHPSIVDCNRKSKLTGQITNAGANFEDEVTFEFKSVPLGINSFDKGISLQAYNGANGKEISHAKTLSIEVTSFFKSGTYPIYVNLYWKNLALFDQKTIDFGVRDCGSSGAKKEIEKAITNKTETVNAEPVSSAKETSEEGFTLKASILNSPALLLILSGGLIILVIIAIIIFGVLKSDKIK